MSADLKMEEINAAKQEVAYAEIRLQVAKHNAKAAKSWLDHEKNGVFVACNPEYEPFENICTDCDNLEVRVEFAHAQLAAARANLQKLMGE